MKYRYEKSIWGSIDPKNGDICLYSKDLSDTIETQYQKFLLDPQYHTISLIEYYNCKIKFINSNYDTDMVFLGYIINNWEKLPSKMIFLRDIGWSKKKAIISSLNKIDDIWGPQSIRHRRNPDWHTG